MRAIRWAVALTGAMVLCASPVAMAQEEPAAPEEPDAIQADLDRLRAEHKQLVEQMKQAQAERKAELDQLRAAHEKLAEQMKQAQAVREAERERMHAAQGELRDELGAAASSMEEAKSGLHPTASVTLRYDNFFLEDQLDLLGDDDYAGGFRTRVRFGLKYDDPSAVVNGGIRAAVGETPNPTASFTAIGDAFRPTGIGLDQYYLSIRPFDDRKRASLTLGKMPQPFWRGDRGGWRSELIWDSDVGPAGVALDVTLFKNDTFKLSNTAGYFVLQDIEDVRFSGLTGPVSLFANQLRLHTEYITAAFAFYDYENLNSGLRAPGVSADSAFLEEGTRAYLLRPGLQSTNRHVNYGPGADGFIEEAYRVVNPSVQGNLPISAVPATELWLMGDFVANTSVSEEQFGVGASLGVRTGDWTEESYTRPLNLWVTYRYVEADATLATFADGDLGGGTDVRGLEVGTSFSVFKSVKLVAIFLDFARAPQMDDRVRRVFGDVVWTY